MIFNPINKLLILVYLVAVFACAYPRETSAQPAPALDENIPFLVTFGANSSTSWGDDDFCQIFFCLIPEKETRPVYIRVFDPDTGNEHDEAKGSFDSEVRFSVYGGKGCWSEEDARDIDPIGNYKSGRMLASKTFGNDPAYDNTWYTFGPFNPMDGEYVPQFKGRVLKIIAEGFSGDDGNLYSYFLSTDAKGNLQVEGGNLFTYEYTFRLHNNNKQISQIYPFIDDKTISVEISNFDWDDDGLIRLVSVAKNGTFGKVSGENNWSKSEFPIVKQENNTTLELQFIKKQTSLVRNNNVAIVVKNQYGETLPFYVIPIGGIPVYSPKILMQNITQ